MGSLRFDLQIAKSRTTIERDWDEFREFGSAESIQSVNVVGEVQAALQRLLNGAALPGEKPLFVTISQEKL